GGGIISESGGDYFSELGGEIISESGGGLPRNLHVCYRYPTANPYARWGLLAAYEASSYRGLLFRCCSELSR
ncbi:hypothetical protein CN173_34150, partial [Sinorhizobium meliloti]